MSDERPDPLVPAEVDLRGYEFMPLYGDRLFASTTWISASPEAKIAALRLWWHAYAKEIPAGSLPDDDKLLADYAGYGVGVKAWQRIRPQAMRGFVLCNDGRWYHPFVAERVMEGWSERLRNREKQRKWRESNRPHNRSGDGNVTVTQPLHTPGTGPLRNAREDRTGQDRSTKSKTLSADADGAFVRFWSAYPRKTAKQAALKAFHKLTPDNTLLTLMLAAIATQEKNEQWQRGIIPHASTWLNQRRWEDELTPAVKPKDTTCQRVLPGTSQRCGMPGRPHPVYGYSCEHCDLKEAEARQSHEMPASVRDRLREEGMLRERTT